MTSSALTDLVQTNKTNANEQPGECPVEAPAHTHRPGVLLLYEAMNLRPAARAKPDDDDMGHTPAALARDKACVATSSEQRAKLFGTTPGRETSREGGNFKL